MPDGYFLKRRCRLLGITSDSQQLTKRTAHLACVKPGQMCIALTQRPDIQQLSHHLCTATSKTTHHEPSHQGGDGCGRYLSMPQLPAMVRNATACASIGRPYNELYH
jgi:hypothetical protein